MDEHLKQLIASQLKGFEVVAEVETTPPADQANQAPSLAAWEKLDVSPASDAESRQARMDRLRERFLGEPTPIVADGGQAPDATQPGSRTFLVRPEGSVSTPKAVVFENGILISRQG